MRKTLIILMVLVGILIFIKKNKEKNERHQLIVRAESKLKKTFSGLIPGLCIEFNEAFDKLNKAGFNIHVIGGVIRDSLMNKSSKDIDFAYDQSFKEIIEFSNKVGFVPYIDKESLTYIKYIGAKSCKTDLEHLEGKSSLHNINIKSPHLLEFTVNTMAYNTITGKIIDKYGGIDDVINRRIRIPPGVDFNRWASHKNGLNHIFRFWKLRTKGFSPEKKTLENIKSYLKKCYQTDRNNLLSHANKFFRSRIRSKKYQDNPEEGAQLLRDFENVMNMDIGDTDYGKAIISRAIPPIGSYKGRGPTDKTLGSISFKLYDFSDNQTVYSPQEKLKNSLEIKSKKILEIAKIYEPKITNLLKTIALKVKGKLDSLESRFKTKTAILQKLNNKENVSDALRYTLVLNDNLNDKAGNYKAALLKSLLILKENGIQLLKLKNSWYPCDAFSSISTKFSWKDLIFEIQFHTPQSKEAQIKSHALYKDYSKESNPKKQCEIFKKKLSIWKKIKAPKGVFKKDFPKEEKLFFLPPKGCEIVCNPIT